MAVSHWSRQQSLVAFSLYCRLPFGRFHSRNPEVIRYANLIQRTPSALAMKLSNIASLDPAITSTGRSGLSGASNADKAMWQEMQHDWVEFSIAMAQAEQELTGQVVINDVTENELVTTSKIAAVKVRIGQQFFRNAVLSAYDQRCCISGLANSKLLVASHIVPWSADEHNRLNPHNGLALSALHDKAFDLGLITISEDYCVVVSSKDGVKNDHFFKEAIANFHGKPITLPEKFYPAAQFLAYHREHIFERSCHGQTAGA
ncbi:putative restriction endonuclease [Arsukibacterium tuosuense]|uniref:Putative restriction endonuclease n=1 Tax=Arsukibacterium tuosuense TaxID=1323745 RepID=A0A285IMU2_9GAMM|nr:HNH endonuclease [Arsukibacterium tuosuense]SNY49203.1 putative restriction endonuclease [Arsukibacterium tuosuense]